MGINRRQFLQLSGMAASGSLLGSCGAKPEKLIPFLVPPDDGKIPDKADYYASTCRQCPAGCGIIVRVSEGHARKIEGNPLHPVNRGKLCARGQAALQSLYHPDRVRQPMRRTGSRGAEWFEPVPWTEAFSFIKEKLGSVRGGKGGRMALLTGPLDEVTAGAADLFAASTGGRRVVYEPVSTEYQRLAANSSYGFAGLPEYDIGSAEYVLSFGADFLDSFSSPVLYGRAFGRMRRARPTVRGLFAYAGPRMSMTAASADTWIPVRPGTEGILALAIAGVVLDESGEHASRLTEAGADAAGIARLLAPYGPAPAARETGIDEKLVVSTARDFARFSPAVAVPGESVAAHTNGLEALGAVHLLNLIAGNVGRPGGVAGGNASPEGPGGIARFSELRGLIKDMSAGGLDAVFIHGVNPAYSIPVATGFREALGKVPLVVSFSSLIDDTAREADIVLPDHADLEGWGLVSPLVSQRPGVIGTMQPVVNPVYDTRPFAEVLMAIAGGLSGSGSDKPGTTGMMEMGMADMVRDHVRRGLGRSAGAEFDREWAGILQKGGVFDEGAEHGAAVFTNKEIKKKFVVPDVRKALFPGDEGEFPLNLCIYQSPMLFDGRSAHHPWLQEAPDPMSTAVWGSWVEINPETAAELGVKHGDLVEVASPVGSLEVPAVVYPAIRPEVAAMPMGQGHRGMGRYAEGTGVNVLDLVDDVMDKENQVPAYGATRVRIRRISEQGGLVTSGHPEGSRSGHFIQI